MPCGHPGGTRSDHGQGSTVQFLAGDAQLAVLVKASIAKMHVHGSEIMTRRLAALVRGLLSYTECPFKKCG